MIFKESQEEYPFNREKLYDYIKKFSFPRLTGTKGEKKAVDLTIKTFKEIGFDADHVITQEFEFSTFYSKALVKIVILLNLIIISIILLIKYLNRFLVFSFILIMVLIFFSMFKALRYPELKGFWEKNFGKFFNATNVFVKIPAKNLQEEKVGNLIVSAHLDSKSQTFRTFWRVIFARTWLYSEIALFSFYALYLIDLHILTEHFIPLILILEIAILLATILTVISNMFLLILKIGNHSRGSLDNASGMSIVFELARFFKFNPLRNFNLWFCQFSAEELGTMGSRKFLDSYENEFTKDYTYQINFDMVSVKNHNKNLIEFIQSYGIFPRKKISPILSEYFKKIAATEKIDYEGFHVSLGAHTDSIPFHLRKFDSIDITTRAAAFYAHSIEDKIDKVDPQILFEACRITQLLLMTLDKEFKNIIRSG